MRWKHYPIKATDNRAAPQVRENLSCTGRTLGNKLLSRFSFEDGELVAIALEDLDLDSLMDFAYATYKSPKRWDEAAGTQTIPIGERPIDGLIAFLTEFLRESDQNLVVMQNALWNRSDEPWNNPIRKPYCLPTRHAFLNEEVYHVLTPKDSDRELMEDTIREAESHWLTGVCAEEVTIPSDSNFSEEFLDELVLKTKHVFIAAFDREGYLIWTPRQKGKRVRTAV